MLDKTLIDSSQTCGHILANSASDVCKAVGVYSVSCYDSEGNLKWEDQAKNLIVDTGKNDLLDKYFAGTTYTAAMYMGLVSGTSYTSAPAAGNTISSHAGWFECGATTYGPDYSSGTRVAVGWNAASGGVKGSTATQFTIGSTANGTTVKGLLIATNNTKQGSTGILVSAGLFSGGDKTVATNDILNVTYTVTI